MVLIWFICLFQNKMDMDDHSNLGMPDSDMLSDMIREEILDGEDSDQVPEGIQPESYENNEEQEEEEVFINCYWF